MENVIAAIERKYFYEIVAEFAADGVNQIIKSKLLKKKVDTVNAIP